MSDGTSTRKTIVPSFSAWPHDIARWDEAAKLRYGGNRAEFMRRAANKYADEILREEEAKRCDSAPKSS